MTTTAEHLRNALDGRFRDVKNRVRAELSNEVFKPHYTPNTVIARTKVGEQLKIMAAAGAAARPGQRRSSRAWRRRVGAPSASEPPTRAERQRGAQQEWRHRGAPVSEVVHLGRRQI